MKNHQYQFVSLLCVFVLVFAISCGVQNSSSTTESETENVGGSSDEFVDFLTTIGVTEEEIGTCLEDNSLEAVTETVEDIGDETTVLVCECLFAASIFSSGDSNCEAVFDDFCSDTDSFEDCVLAANEENIESNDDSDSEDSGGPTV